MCLKMCKLQRSLLLTFFLCRGAALFQLLMPQSGVLRHDWRAKAGQVLVCFGKATEIMKKRRNRMLLREF